MNTNTFQNKTCWITGASSGIGAALVRALGQCGANLILSSRDRNKLEIIKAQSPYPEKIAILTLDLENVYSLPEYSRQAWQLFRGIDYVFLNAGMAVRDMIDQTEMNLVQKLMNINFFSNVAIAKSLLPLMRTRGSGRFVVTSSLSGKFGIPKLGAYSASKHALHGFFETLRAEYECDGIAVTMVIPGMIRTDITLNALTGTGGHYGKMQASVGAGMSPDDCAKAIIKAVVKEKCEALIGSMEKYSVLFKRFFPGLLRIMMRKHPLRKLRKLGLLRNDRPETPTTAN